MEKLFLISSSYYKGGPFWGHCFSALEQFLGKPEGEKNWILFIPYAKADGRYDFYTDLVSKPFERLGYKLINYDTFSDCPHAIIGDERTVGLCIGGGNTWLLNYLMQKKILFDVKHLMVRKIFRGEWKYTSASAGTVTACPTFLTTNDMAPVLPKSSKALHLISFQINPHFVPGSLVPKHMGETREERIMQFLMHNPDMSVVGLPESCWIEVEGGTPILRGVGNKGAVIFNKKGNTFWKINSQMKL